MSDVDKILADSEQRERDHPLAKLEESVEWAEFRDSISTRSLKALRGIAEKFGPVIVDAGAKALAGFLAHEVDRRMGRS